MALTDYVIMPGADYQAACDVIRAKTGATALIKSGELAAEIENNLYEDYTTSPNLTKIADYAYFEMCSLRSLTCPKVTAVGKYALERCTSLTSVSLPLVSGVGIYAFYGCTSLTTLELPSASIINACAFYLSNLTTLVLSGDSVCELYKYYSQTSGAGQWFHGTPIEQGNGAIYVPDALVDSYKAATNWSDYADYIKPLSEYTATN